MKRTALALGVVLAVAGVAFVWLANDRRTTRSEIVGTESSRENDPAANVALDASAHDTRASAAVAVTPETNEHVARASDAKPDESCRGRAVLRGLVADEAGLPIEGAVLKLTIHTGPNGWDLCGAEAVTDRAGRFEMRGIVAGAFEGRCEHGEFLEGEIPPGTLARDGVVECATIVMRRGLMLTGQVVQADGTPAPRTRLVLKSAGNAEFEAALAKVAWGDASANGAELRQLFSGGFETSMTEAGADEEGRFRFGPLEDGVYDLAATFDPSARTDVPPAMRKPATDGVLSRARVTVKNVRPGGDPIRVVLVPSLRVRGFVADGDGRPVRAFRVRAGRRSNSPLAGVLRRESKIDAVFADERGEFELSGFAAGEFEIVVSTDDGRRSKPQVVTIPQEMLRAEFALLDCASIRGVVRDEAGRPIRNATVSVQYEHVPFFVREARQHGSITDETGEFAIAKLPPEQVHLLVGAEGFRTPDARDLELLPRQVLENVTLVLQRKP